MTSPELRPVVTRQSSVASSQGSLATGNWQLIALLILLLAAAFRLVALGDVPPGLAQGEVVDADIALFIRGGEHALCFRHGYGHEPLYHYLAAPFAPLLGDNWLAIRLPSVYLGLLLVALTMLGGSPGLAPLTLILNTISGTLGNRCYLLSAAAFISSALPVAVFLSLHRYFVRCLLAGGTKG